MLDQPFALLPFRAEWRNFSKAKCSESRRPPTAAPTAPTGPACDPGPLLHLRPRETALRGIPERVLRPPGFSLRPTKWKPPEGVGERAAGASRSPSHSSLEMLPQSPDRKRAHRSGWPPFCASPSALSCCSLLSPSPCLPRDQPLGCVQLSDPMDCSPPGSSLRGILQARSGLPLPPPGDHPNQLRDRTQASYIADRFFTIWDMQGSPRMATAYLFIDQPSALSQASLCPRYSKHHSGINALSFPSCQEICGLLRCHGC